MENKPSDRVAANVRQLRHERGLSLAQLSQQLAEQGYRLTLPVLSKIELGERGIDVDDLVALAFALNVSPGLLLENPGHENLRRLLIARDAAARDLDRGAEALADAEAVLARAQDDLGVRVATLAAIDRDIEEMARLLEDEVD